MALSQKHRSSIYTQLSPILGEEETEALLSQFPARELDEPVTKEFVRAETADVRAEIAMLRAEMSGELGKVRTEIAALEARINERLRQMTIWMAGSMTVGMGIATGIGRLVG